MGETVDNVVQRDLYTVLARAFMTVILAIGLPLTGYMLDKVLSAVERHDTALQP